MGASALGVATLRPLLKERYRAVTKTGDVYALPSPQQTIVMSLGYRSALADLLYANVLVSYGVHFQEKRRFEFVGNYLETINELDPKFAAPYRFADTLLTLQPKKPRWKDFVKARQILERGMRERPTDGQLHTNAGLFLAYLAPGQAPTQTLKNEYRILGARSLARACELIGDNKEMPFHCVVAADLFSRAGQREAQIGFLRRFLAITDDEEVRRIALGHLRAAVGEQEQERLTRRTDALNRLWGADLPFVTKDTLLVIGPATNPGKCAGSSPRRDGCESSWRAWSAAQH